VTHDEAARLVAVMFSAVPSHRVEAKAVPAMINAYADLLGDLTYAQCNAALRVLLQTSTWLPSVAEIRAAALEVDRGPVRAGGDAWGDVLRAVSRYGAYRRPGEDFTFADPVVARCVQSLGWQQICASENVTADRAQFIRLYDTTAGQTHRQAQAPMLAAGAEQRALDASGLVANLARQLGGGS
jgi:hypothetical protein